MSDPENLLRLYYAAWTNRQPNTVLEFFGADSVFEDLGFEARFEGLSQIRSFVELTYAGVPDFGVSPEVIICDGDNAAASWVMSGTQVGDLPGLPATGRCFRVPATSIVTVREGVIQTIVDYWNLNTFKRCVGLT